MVMDSDMNRRWWRLSGLWKVLYALLLGQSVSFILALLSFSSSLSANLGANSPITLQFFGYLALTLVYGSTLLYQRHELLIPWYWYALLAFFDVQGNYLYNAAYYFSSIMSVAILDCWTVAWVILFTWIFLGTKYSLWQFLGAGLCGIGLCLVLLSDAGVGGGGGSNPLLGDTLVIAGTCLFALSNVGEIFTFVGYSGASFMFYTLTLLILQTSGATLFNLSLLTADMWAVVIRIFFYHQQVDWLYYVSFAIVGVGLVIYSKT